MMVANFWETFWTGYVLGVFTIPAVGLLSLLVKQ
mgnify:CR=1 FL=1